MNRTLLAGILLVLPSFASAAPCDVLTYANQCQGSNLWPVPAGWVADNNGDCQPEPDLWRPILEFKVGVHKGGSLSAACALAIPQVPASPWGASAWCVSQSKQVQNYFSREAGFACLLPATSVEVIWNPDAGTNMNFRCCQKTTTNNLCTGVVAESWGSLAMGPIRSCPTGYYSAVHNYPDGASLVECRLDTPSVVAKPPDGVCTARWTSSVKTTLQKDPLDPDCDANSCVFDGTCELR